MEMLGIWGLRARFSGPYTCNLRGCGGVIGGHLREQEGRALDQNCMCRQHADMLHNIHGIA